MPSNTDTPDPRRRGGSSDEGGDASRADDLVVSIINYRTAALTCDCIASVLDDLRTAGEVRAHVVVVDNDSGDGSAEAIEAWIAARPGAPVTLVRSPSNSGFAGGHNLGIAARDASFYLVLNSDAILRPGFCRAILAAAGAHPRAGLLAPRLEDADGTAQTSCFRIPSPLSELVRGAATGPVTSLLRRHVVALDMPPEPGSIGWASFACILLRRAMIDEVGPMDEGYFLYFEDTEYCLRARRAGWEIAYVPGARAVHFRGGSGPVKAMAKAGRRLPRYFYRSRARLFRQAHGPAGPAAANVAWVLGRVIGRLRGRPAREREAVDIWTDALRPARERDRPDRPDRDDGEGTR